MKRQWGRSKGFTLVELIVIITVIGILAGIFILSLSRYQMAARDAQRSSQVSAISEALEKYYDENGEYPSCRSVIQTPQQVSTDVLKGTDRSIYTAPLGESGVNSLQCNDITGNTTDSFGYVGDGSSTCSNLSTGSSCLSFSLQYKEESTGNVISVDSRRKTNIATSGIITNLSATASGFDRVALTWGAVNNAANYIVQYSTNNFSSFSTFAPSPTTNSVTVTGLSYNTAYSFRVIPNGSSGAGTASNVDSATTWSLSTPTITAGATTNNSIQFSWGAINRADDYLYQISTASDFSSTIANTATASTLVTQSGLAAGERYYVRVQARAQSGAFNGNWGSISIVTVLPVPTGVAVTTLSVSQIRENWNAVSATGVTYTAQCSTNNTTWNSSCETANIAGLNNTFSSLDQGRTYYARVQANTADADSAWSSSVSTTTQINAPAAFTMSSSNDGATLYGTANATCGQGTTIEYLWRANGGNWVQGTQYRSVGYTVSPGSTVTLTVAAKCNGANIDSGWTWANNSASFSRPGLSLSMSTGSDGCGGSFCGRQVNAYWNNFCGGGGTITGVQYSYSDSWSVSGGSNTTRWKGASSPGAPLTYYLSMCSTSASASINVVSAYKCQGCS